ncbi:MAG TPA: hypothetical protein VF523_19565 [Burkholderiales bacterium]
MSEPAPATAPPYDPIAYQTALSLAHASIRTAIQRRQLDPMRYIVEIDAGLPIFAMRETHLVRIAYNRFQTLAAEATIPHEWMMEQTGKGHEDFLNAVDDLVMALKGKIQSAGRPM